MLPMTARILMKDHEGRGVNLWLPLFLLWPVLLIFLFLCLPIFCFWGLFQFFRGHKKFKVLQIISAVYGLLIASRGLVIDIEDRSSKVKIFIK